MGAVLQSQHILTIVVNVLIQNDIRFITGFRLAIPHALGTLNMFCILVYFSSYPMPWPLRPLPFKSGLARSWVRLALGSRPLLVGSCLFASGQSGNAFYGVQGTLVYPSYPIYPLYPVESAVDAGPLCLQCTLVYPSYPVYLSYAVMWRGES